MHTSSNPVARRASVGDAAATTASYASAPSAAGPSAITCLMAGICAASARPRSASAALATSTPASESSAT